jgi:hypothetical protein
MRLTVAMKGIKPMLPSKHITVNKFVGFSGVFKAIGYPLDIYALI